MEAIITTIILVSLFLVIRRLVQGKISAKIQYALWLIVAIKLLTVFIPMPESAFSVMNIQTLFGERIELKQETKQADAVIQNVNATNAIAVNELAINNANATLNQKRQVMKQRLKTKEIALSIFWKLYLLGIGLILVKMILDNSRLYRYLKNNRIKFKSPSSILPVYLVDGLETPFLYGRSIYIPTKLAGDSQKIKHILAHENCHYMQGDCIWGLVRGICLTLHWYNPLVWLAVKRSKQDAELACDERSVKCLGEKERISYAETLVNLIISQNHAKDLFVLSTSMSGSKKGIKERIMMITKKPRTLLAVLGLTIIGIVAIVCTTFTQGGSTTPAVGTKETTTETKAETTTEKEVQDVSANQVATVSENASEEAKTEINYEWYKEAKVYQRADGVKFQMGFLDIPAEPVDGLEIETEPERANDAFQFTIIDNDTGMVLSAYFKQFFDSNEDYLSYVFEEESDKRQQMIVNYYYKTDTIQIVDNWDDGEDYNGEYK